MNDAGDYLLGLNEIYGCLVGVGEGMEGREEEGEEGKGSFLEVVEAQKGNRSAHSSHARTKPPPRSFPWAADLRSSNW